MTSPDSVDRTGSTVRPLARGFTLIELMVVIVILGLLMGIVGPHLFGTMDRATKDTAMNQMHNFGGAIDLYTLEYKNLPKSLDDLTHPSAKTSAPFMKKIPRDPWNEPYDYKIVNLKSLEYQISTSGGDRQPGTDDDLVFPEPDSK